MLIESLARTFAAGLDAPPLPAPVALAEMGGLTLEDWQRDVVLRRDPQTALLCGRQVGKSTVAALAATDEAIHRAPALVLVLAVAQRQAQELFRRVKALLAALGPLAPPVRQESALGLEFHSGSRIICLPGTEATVRSFSGVALLVIDEAARVRDDLYQAVRPMTAISQGRIILLSTPAGRRGFFYSAVTEHRADWHVITVPATACPRLSPLWLAAERARIGDFWYRQEYLCEFLDDQDAVFSSDAIARCVRPEVRPLRLFSAA